MSEVRLIDANALKDIEYINKGNFNTVEGIRAWVDNAPTVNIIQHKDWYLVNKAGVKELLDRERPQGEWGKNGECPFCSYIRQWEEDIFCGNCGAKLQKGGAE